MGCLGKEDAVYYFLLSCACL